MKILIKANCEVYQSLNQGHYKWHCSCYYPFLFRELFRRLGHQCNFIWHTQHKQILTTAKEYDILIYWGLESFCYDRDYATSLLKDFKGKKVLYITTESKDEIINNFDYIIGTDVEEYKLFYQKYFPNIKYKTLAFASPLFDFVDEDQSNPYNNDYPRVVYIGLIKSRYLNILNNIATHGIPIALGGTYFSKTEQWTRAFTEYEVKNLLHPNITLFSKDGTYSYGEHWKFLKYATIGLNFSDGSKAVNSKLVDYLVCGLPVVSENNSINAFYLNELNAGYLVNHNNFSDILFTVDKALGQKWDKNNIQFKARDKFAPIKIGQQILEFINE